PTAPAIKQPRTAKPTTVSALEPRSDAGLRLSVCACVLIFVLPASRIDQKPAGIPPDSQQPVSAPHFGIIAPPLVAARNKLSSRQTQIPRRRSGIARKRRFYPGSGSSWQSATNPHRSHQGNN